MIYEQYLDEKSTRGFALKKLFLVLGFIDIALGFVLAIIFAFIYWVFALPFVGLLILGLILGCISYTFCKTYKYTYENGVFKVFYLNCYGRYREKLGATKSSINRSNGKGKCLTNLNNYIVIEVCGEKYHISPDDYMTALLFGE